MFEGVWDPKSIAWSGLGRGCCSEQSSRGYCSDCEYKVRRFDRHPASPCVFSRSGPLLGALVIQQRCVITGDIHSMPLLAAMFWPGRHRNADRRAGCRPTARPPTATPFSAKRESGDGRPASREAQCTVGAAAKAAKHTDSVTLGRAHPTGRCPTSSAGSSRLGRCGTN
jgi:hypothetical protein